MKSTYTRDFGTYIGRFRPRSNGISGSVSRGYIKFLRKIQKQRNIWKHNLYVIHNKRNDSTVK